MFYGALGAHRALWNCVPPRKRVVSFWLVILVLGIIGILLLSTLSVNLSSEEHMEERIFEINTRLQFLQSQYRGKQENVIYLQAKVLKGRGNDTGHHTIGNDTTTMSNEVMALLKNLSGSKSAESFHPDPVQEMRVSFIGQLLPHIMNDPNSLTPAFHMKSPKTFADFVIGIPTVKRDKESYLMTTLLHLISGLTETDRNSTLIVIMIGETDLEYVLLTASQIEKKFPHEVQEGLIEVVSPLPMYYPDLESVPPSLGDSAKRVKWRTKQNLDTIYLMSFCQSRGAMYLMLEDDVVAKEGYMQEIKKFTKQTSIQNPNWFFIEYCHVGGIGKLFKSPDLVHFLIYVQLFYTTMPVDWLLESYLTDRVCTIDKTSKLCGESKNKIRPKYKTSLFQHIGLYSSLKGKIQKVKKNKYGIVPSYYPHNNPPVKRIETDIIEHSDHTIKRAYEGKTFFWGKKPKSGNVIEFWFAQPTRLKSFYIQSGNAEHTTDKFYKTIVEGLVFFAPDYTYLGSFDEFGLADGLVDPNLGILASIRLKVMNDSNYWVILSEIIFQPIEDTKKVPKKLTADRNRAKAVYEKTTAKPVDTTTSLNTN